ncbi:hypothetical protein MAR621_04139 [Maribacter dokdonensis]|uniref:hypothetical protein n=1 Tax=Maribacter dokdonensis TaxID=320912 RepID=UPI001B08764E|nr:hypothetical protein [Maribacter dokdonensis]CAG2535003.1 hypothetical protein MAR621_04139 [Maribacter dokdonensis]
MKHPITLLLLILAIGCNSKKETNRIEKVQKNEIMLSEKLESFGFFTLMENKHKIKEYKTIIDSEFSENS